MESPRQDFTKEKTLCLDATRDGDCLKIGIHNMSGGIWSYEEIEEIPVSLDKIEARCREMTEEMNKAGRKGGQVSGISERLRGMGDMLCNELLPPAVKEKLTRAEGGYLILKLDEHLVHIPWELLCAGDGFLCERFKTGRMVRTRQKITESEERKIVNPMKMWILADPRNDLPSADLEGEQICDDMDMMNQDREVIEASLDSDNITRDVIQERLKSYDFVHFAGHADFVSQEPGQSGWRVADGNFEADDIYKMMGGRAMPALVFSNACQSARTDEWACKDEIKTFGLANAFMLAGVKHYIGTSWDIMDEPSSRFALQFYKNLLSGKTVGESVKQARLSLIERGDEACWASYLLYGDPREAYFDPMGEDSSGDNDGEPDIPERGNSGDNDGEPDIPERGNSGNNDGESDIPERGNSGNNNEDPERDSFKEKSRSTKEDDDPEINVSSTGGATMQLSPSASPNIWKGLFAGLLTLIIGVAVFSHWPQEEPFEKWLPVKPMTLAVVFDSVGNVFDDGKMDILTGAIESQLLKDCPHIKLVTRDRMIMKRIQEEWDLWKSKYMDPDYRPKASLWGARLILHFGVNDSGSQLQITMRLIDTARSVIHDSLGEKLDELSLILEQKKAFTKALIKSLKMLYPLRGRISEVTGKEITLNVGKQVGVKPGHQFRVTGKNVILEVESVRADDTSRVRVIKGDIPLKKGWEVEGIEGVEGVDNT